ncbi:MAG: hypothetical protein HWE11_12760 [Gammaproteobacteria bacterium]|nr:hypothetical protein [Gammaproteobacteria bacterium]
MKIIDIDKISISKSGAVELDGAELEAMAAMGAGSITGAGTNQRCDNTSNSACRNTRSCEGSSNSTCVNGSYLYKCEGVEYHQF